MFLHPHNQETYQNLTALFRTHNRVAVVQPTGTGKSFLMLQLIQDNPDSHFLLAAPSIYIFTQIQTHAAEHGIPTQNCDFLTFSKLAQMEESEIENLHPDHILLDEFHRCGATEWSRGIGKLLAAFPSAKILGTSATPIRYLDSFRNMAEELFHGVYAVNLSLAEAIRRKILPLPIYVTSWYSFRGEMALLEKKAAASDNPFYRRILQRKIRKAKTLIADQNCSLDAIFAKHMPQRNGKYIVFCASVERLQQALGECRSWFHKVNSTVHTYQVFSENTDSQQEFEQFRDDNSDALKLLFCIDMLNEGVHVHDIDGVIMLRATQSANVFYQQLGRALSCSSGKQPVIFDIVNNFETGDTAKQYREIMEIGREYGQGEDFEIEFELYDYVRDIRELLSDMRNTFEDSWEVVYEALCEFITQNHRFPEYQEKYGGYRLGVWCSNQRQLRNTESLSEERMQKLDAIGFLWDAKDERWQGSFRMVQAYKEKYGKFPSRTDPSEEAQRVYQWITNQRHRFKQGLLSEERKAQLESIGISMTTQSLDEAWQNKYDLLRKFVEIHGHFPTLSESKTSEKVCSIYRWISKQRKAYADGKLSSERIQKLEEIGMIWNKAEALWEERFRILQEFVGQNRRMPIAKDKQGTDCIGQWYVKQIRYSKDGTLAPEKAKRLEELAASVQKREKLVPMVREMKIQNHSNGEFYV